MGEGPRRKGWWGWYGCIIDVLVKGAGWGWGVGGPLALRSNGRRAVRANAAITSEARKARGGWGERERQQGGVGGKAGNGGREGLPQLPELRSPQRARKYFCALFFFLPFPRHGFIILHRCEAGATLAEARRGSLHAEALIPPLSFFTLSFSPSHEPNWVHRVKARSTDLYTSRGLLLNTLPIVIVFKRYFPALLALQWLVITFMLQSLLHLSTPAYFLVKYRMCLVWRIGSWIA